MSPSKLLPCQPVLWRGYAAVIVELKGLDRVIIRIKDHLSTENVDVGELVACEDDAWQTVLPTYFRDGKERATALARLELIRPILETAALNRSDVQRDLAYDLGCSQVSLQRLITDFEATGLLASLSADDSSDAGTADRACEVDDLVARQISRYVTSEGVSDSEAIYQIIRKQCQMLGIPLPNRESVFAKVTKRRKHDELQNRYCSPSAFRKYPLANGSSQALQPLELVRIGHSLLSVHTQAAHDVDTVSDGDKGMFKYPYVTLCIDAATSMVAGFSITVEPPGADSVGLSLIHAAAHKDMWLVARDVVSDWPLHGAAIKVQTDLDDALFCPWFSEACDAHGVKTEPLDRSCPDIGAYIADNFRQFVGENYRSHDYPGNGTRAQVDDQDSPSCMSFEELETWFTAYLVLSYNRRAHPGICEKAPVHTFYEITQGISGESATGLPVKVEDEAQFRKDFAPQRKIARGQLLTLSKNQGFDNVRKFTLKWKTGEAGHDGRALSVSTHDGTNELVDARIEPGTQQNGALREIFRMHSEIPLMQDVLADIFEQSPSITGLFLIVQNSNSDRSNLIRQFVMRHPADENEGAEHIRLPVFTFDMSLGISIADMYASILNSLFKRAPDKLALLRQKTFEAFKAMGLRMLIINNLDQVLSGTGDHKSALLLELRSIANNVGLALVGCGSDELLQACSMPEMRNWIFKRTVIDRRS